MTNHESNFSIDSCARGATLGDRRGFVLPTVVFAVAVMSIVVVAAMNSSTDERRSSRATKESTLALYAAEGGLRQVYGAWPSASVKALNPGDSLDLGWQDLPNKEKYRAVIHRVDRGGLQEYNVVVQGRRLGVSGGISTIVGVVGGIPLLTYGVYSKTNISLSGGGLIDSYDSEEAPYLLANADSNATIWSNGTVSIQRTTIKGTLGAAGAITNAAGVNVTGGETQNAPAAPAMDINACPTGGYTPASQIPTGLGISYNQTTGVLTLSAGAVLTLTAAQYYFSQVILTGNSSLSVNPPSGSHIEVVVGDSLNMQGGTVVNVPDAPTRLGFSSCGTPTPLRNWVVTGGADAAFSVYAPNHPVTLTGNGSMFGAIVASTFTETGGASLHYDEALARLPSNKLIVQKSTWSMLPGN